MTPPAAPTARPPERGDANGPASAVAPPPPDRLARYWAKRDFAITSEPRGGAANSGAELAFVGVSGSATHTAQMIDSVERFVWSFPEVEVLSTRRGWLEEES